MKPILDINKASVYFDGIFSNPRLQHPEGVYFFANPIWLPPAVNLIGDAPGKTVLEGHDNSDLHHHAPPHQIPSSTRRVANL